MDALNGNRYGCTTAAGEYGEVEVSAATLAVVHQATQAVITSFQWKGPERHAPT
jgi:hypothetical protein